MRDFGIPGAISSGPGCTRHGTMIYKNGMPFCLGCAAEEGKTNAVPAGIVTVEDPGAEALAKLPAVATKDAVEQVAPVVASGDFSTCIGQAIKILQSAPMPNNMSQFKAVMSAIKTLTKLTAL